MKTEALRRSRSAGLVLDALRRGKSSGTQVTNMDLSTICLRFGARLFELRKMGYEITTTAGKSGLFIYKLKKEPN